MAQREILGKLIVIIGQIDSVPDILLVIVFSCAALLALKAMLTPPGLWQMLDRRLQAKRVIRPVTYSTKHEQVFIGGFAAALARLTVEALPVRLVHSQNVTARKLQAIRVETLAAEYARNKVFLVSKRATQVAHLLKN